MKELEYVLHAVGGFLGDNRAGIPGTLHRISAIKNREGTVVGLTCRVGRAVNGAVNMVHDLLNYGKNILFVGRLVLYFLLILKKQFRCFSGISLCIILCPDGGIIIISCTNVNATVV